MSAASHLAGEWFSSVAGANLKFIHYNTATPYTDLMSGQILTILEAVLPAFRNVKAGRLKVLAISGKSRWPLLPDVPTFTEAGHAAYDPLVWIGLLAPAGTLAEFASFLNAERTKWGAVVKQANVKIE